MKLKELLGKEQDKLFQVLNTHFAADQHEDLLFGSLSERQSSTLCSYTFKATDLIYRCLCVLLINFQKLRR